MPFGGLVEFDVFISHAGEDKDLVARPIAEGLRVNGLRVWFDEYVLQVGESLSESIDRGLARSRYGVVVLSPDFFAKPWPRRELGGLVSREAAGVPVILPVWHNLSHHELQAISPTLADRVASRTETGIERVVAELSQVIAVIHERAPSPPETTPPEVHRFEVPAPLDIHIVAPGDGSVQYHYSVIEVVNRSGDVAVLDITLDVETTGTVCRVPESYRLVLAPYQRGTISQAAFSHQPGVVLILGGVRAAVRGDTQLRIADLISSRVEHHPL